MAILPALLLALFGAWCGTLPGGASFVGAAVGEVALLVLILVVPGAGRDPLGLGRTAWLAPLAWAVVAVSAFRSPVGRAGLVGLVMLPAFFLVVPVVAHCWGTPHRRRWAGRSMSLVVLLSALWALFDRFVGGSPRAAMPIGHHTLLGAWLVLTVPLLVPLRRESGSWRIVGGVAAAAAAGSLLATASAGGLLAAVVEVVLLLVWRQRRKTGTDRAPSQGRWIWLAAGLFIAIALGVVGLRTFEVAQKADPSWQVRSGYWEAASRALRARPWFGWGPGSVAWTSAEFLRPGAAVDPWGEVVGELHALPAQIGYELGGLGLAVGFALVGMFVVRRWREIQSKAEEDIASAELAFAGLVALAGGAVVGFATGAVRVTALPLAVAVAAGAAMATRAVTDAPRRRPIVLLYGTVAVLSLYGPSRGQWHYERSLGAVGKGDFIAALREISAATESDPDFPLYAFRRALLLASARPADSAAARLAGGAARDAEGIPVLWLVAGILEQQAGLPASRDALTRSCTLDPFSPFPAFYRVVGDPSSPEAPDLAALALLADPRLGAATFWEARPALYDGSLHVVDTWTGTDAGWRSALRAAVPDPSTRSGPVARLGLTFDGDPARAFSLHAFRRRPWPTTWPLVSVRQDLLPVFGFPPAVSLPSSASLAPPRPVCGLRPGGS
jgi:O-antigen ligase